MKKILLLIIVLVAAVTSFAQPARTKVQFAYSIPSVANRFAFTNNGIWTDSNVIFTKLVVPADTVLVAVRTSGADAGMLYSVTVSNLRSWVGGGGGGSTDSTVFATLYRLDTMRTNVYNFINTKFNTSDTGCHWIYDIYRNNDSLFYRKCGTSTFISALPSVIDPNCDSIAVHIDSLPVTCHGAKDGMFFLTDAIPAYDGDPVENRYEVEIDGLFYDADTCTQETTCHLFGAGSHQIFIRLKSNPTCTKVILTKLDEPEKVTGFVSITPPSWDGGDGMLYIHPSRSTSSILVDAVISPADTTIRVSTGDHEVIFYELNAQSSGVCTDTIDVRVDSLEIATGTPENGFVPMWDNVTPVWKRVPDRNCPDINIDVEFANIGIPPTCNGICDALLFPDTTGVTIYIDGLLWDESQLWCAGAHTMYVVKNGDTNCTKTYNILIPEIPQMRYEINVTPTTCGNSNGMIQIWTDSINLLGTLNPLTVFVDGFNTATTQTYHNNYYAFANNLDTGWHYISITHFNGQFSGLCDDSVFFYVNRGAGYVDSIRKSNDTVYHRICGTWRFSHLDAGGGTGVNSVTDDGNDFVDVDNTDPDNPVINWTVTGTPDGTKFLRDDATWATPSGSGQTAIQFKDEGSNIGTSGGVSAVDFTGGGVTATHSSGTVTVTIPNNYAPAYSGLTTDVLTKFNGTTLANSLLSESGSVVTLNGDMIPNADNSRDLGSATRNWRNTYVINSRINASNLTGNFLTLAANGDPIGMRTPSQVLSDIGGAPSFTATNGLTLSSNVLKLGGTLTETTTTIAGDSKNLVVSNLASYTQSSLVNGDNEKYEHFHTDQDAEWKLYNTSTPFNLARVFIDINNNGVNNVIAESQSADAAKRSAIEMVACATSNVNDGYVQISQTAGNFMFTGLANQTSASRLLGVNSSGTAKMGYITIGSGLSLSSGALSATATGTNTGDQNLFSSIPVSGQTTVTANSTTTALTFVAGSNMTITTNNTTKEITFASSGSGGGHTIQENGVDLTARSNLNFLPPFTATDNAGDDATDVDIDESAITAGAVANALSISAELISGGASSYNGSAAKSIGIQPTSVTNAMLAGSIANAKLSNSTISGISLGSNLADLTIGTNLSLNSGTTYNGGTAKTLNLADATDAVKGAASFPEHNLVVSSGAVSFRKSLVTLTSTAGASTYDVDNGYNSEITMTEDVTITINDAEEGDFGLIVVTQDGTGGWDITVPDATVTIGTGAGDVSHLAWFYDGTTFSWRDGNGGTGGSGTVTSVALTAPSVFSVSGSPVTTNGTLAVTFAGGQTQNQVLASPNGSSGAVGLRALVAADIPTLNQNTTGSAGSVANALSIAAELISGGASSYDGSAAKSIGIQAASVTNAMLAGSIDLTTKVTGVLPPANGGTGVNNGSKTITLSGNTTIGSSTHTVAFATGANTSVTLPSSGTLATLAGTETFTNKRITPKITSISSNATWSPSADNDDIYLITAQAANVTTISNPTGTPVDGQVLTFRVKDNGTARTLAGWGSEYRAGTNLPFPTTTTLGKWMYIRFIRNAADTKWDLVSVIDGL